MGLSFGAASPAEAYSRGGRRRERARRHARPRPDGRPTILTVDLNGRDGVGGTVPRASRGTGDESRADHSQDAPLAGGGSNPLCAMARRSAPRRASP